MMDDPVILKIFLIGFHHKQGWKIDECYPSEDESNKLNIDTHLETLCLPDQSHNFESDSVYFVLPKTDEKIFGVSCFKQIPTEQLTNRTENDEFSRSSVQKSVCCLMKLPIFGYIETRLSLIVDKIFDEGNFTCLELLKDSYLELNRCINSRIQTCPTGTSDFINDFYIGISLRELILTWRHKILILFKLMLLEKRVLFFGSPVKPVCSTIMSVISLHPQLINKGLGTEIDLTSPIEIVIDDEKSLTEELKSDPEFDALKPITLPMIPPAEWLAPMQIFKNGFLCLPFISLPYIDILMDKSHNGFVAGASNVLFQQKKNLVDVMIDVPTLSIDFIDPEMKKCLQLTTEDLRFFEHIKKGIENPKQETGYGMDAWIRQQFESYFVSMLRTIYDNHHDLEFNENFMEVWRKTNNYQGWLARKITQITSNPEAKAFDMFPIGHPFSKSNNAITVTDLKNKLVQSISNSQNGRKINQAVNNTLSNAKTTFSTWLSNFSAKEDNVINMEEREKRTE